MNNNNLEAGDTATWIDENGNTQTGVVFSYQVDKAQEITYYIIRDDNGDSILRTSNELT
ncbi:MAG: hypothetical protein COA63_013980 [Methylophaga sp.]|nr:hypothetical protein [Methylophaga sp.]